MPHGAFTAGFPELGRTYCSIGWDSGAAYFAAVRMVQTISFWAKEVLILRGRRSTLGPRWVNRGSPFFGGQPWVPAQKSSTVGPRDQLSLLRALGNQTKLSTFDTVAFRVRRRPDLFHARLRAPPLHSPCQKFGNTDYFLKIPAKATMRGWMKLWEAAQ